MSSTSTHTILTKQGVSFGSEVLEAFDAQLASQQFTKVFFLVDEHTHEHCLPILLAALSNLKEFEILEIEPGEESKSHEVLINLYYALTELGADRKTLLVNVGGGVVTDLGGFLASTFMRGIAFVNFPTSLLAMVDASVGGKTGIDLGEHKNQVGVFAAALQVYVYPSFLQTLPHPHIKAGYAEMLKHGLIADSNYFYELLSALKAGKLPSETQILSSIHIKAQVVEEDFKESAARKKLNFGHSLGHAIEGCCLANGVQMLHGDAVALGMLGELYLSYKKTRLPKADFIKTTGALRDLYAVKHLNIERKELIHLLLHDKKNEAGELRFVLLEQLGKPIINVPVTKKEAEQAFQFIFDGDE